MDGIILKNNCNNTEKRYKRVLSIAGSDSSGGAGIQADLKTISALGCYGMTVITALTAQNTKGVNNVLPIPSDFVRDQMKAIFDDIGTDALKIGMLYSKELVEAVSEILIEYKVKNIVFDPVMVAQSGDKLIQDEAIASLKKSLFPIADIITPNIPEAEVILDSQIKNPTDAQNAAKEISHFYGCPNVLVKGGHLLDEDSCVDYLYMKSLDKLVEIKSDRIITNNNHGTGCTLSSAIAAYLAKNENMEESVKKAKFFVHKAIFFGRQYKIGQGHGPIHHFFKSWE
ncbi:MAG: bifunctional hydroxymethylpyrimidine kinase/phosphomethylpyrimidine kinase [Desulfobacterales bacterium]|nr:bifunctional hydroxymethylpyrimidine kinase/phosphomethylpyrimidine kinase [Desulfobacterales bacterium]